MAKVYKCDICGKFVEQLGAVYLCDKYQAIFKDAHSERVFDICIDCAHELQKVIYERSANSEYRK